MISDDRNTYILSFEKREFNFLFNLIKMKNIKTAAITIKI